MAGIRFKKTHIANILALKDHQGQPRQNLRWLNLVKEQASDEQSTQESFENEGRIFAPEC